MLDFVESCIERNRVRKIYADIFVDLRRKRVVFIHKRLDFFEFLCSRQTFFEYVAASLFKLDYRGFIVILIEIKNVLYNCSTELIDTLVIITDNHNILIFCRKQKRQLKLGIVCILILVYANITVSVLKE